MDKILHLPHVEIYHIKIMLPLQDEMSDTLSKKSPYRVLALEKDTSLSDLGYMVLDLFDFDFDHLFGFYDNLKWWADSDEAYEMEEESFNFELDENPTKSKSLLDKVTIGDIFTRKGKKWLMLYDYGDEWKFWLTLDKKVKYDPSIEYPVLIAAKYDSPRQYPDWDEEEIEG
ncbi:MAG: hypothetical protein RIG77_15255 [Cyclobacteriaceae bacterium]